MWPYLSGRGEAASAAFIEEFEAEDAKLNTDEEWWEPDLDEFLRPHERPYLDPFGCQACAVETIAQTELKLRVLAFGVVRRSRPVCRPSSSPRRRPFYSSSSMH